MTYSIEFIPEAAADYKSLDGSVKKKVNKKLEELSKNPFLGEYLGNHGYEPQSKLRGIIPSAVRDCSTNQFRRASHTELEFHNKFNVNLTGFYKLYVDNKKIRIVYRLLGEEIEIIEVWGIGKRDKEEIYRLIGHRLKKKQG